jgi:heme/copper-type cytochrome/quinol oxidase subunit 4
MVLITSLSFASNSIDSFGDQVGFNSSLLLTTVAYLFITKDVTPATAEVTLLDGITYGALLLSWMLIMLHFMSIEESDVQKKREEWIGLALCATTVGIQICLITFLFVRYKYIMYKSEKLGDLLIR